MTSEDAQAPRSTEVPSTAQEPSNAPLPATAQMLGELDRIQSAECREIVAEVDRARILLRDASTELMSSFRRLSSDTQAQQQRVSSVLATMSDSLSEDENEGLNIPAFVAQTATVLQNFVEVLVHFSKQSVTISYKIDDMVEHMDAIFELVSQVDSIAEDTNILAINAALEAARAGEAGKGFKVVASEVRSLSRDTKALNEQIGSQVDAARTVIDEVREAARAIASQDMSMALNAKGGVDDMLERLRGMDEKTASVLDDLTEFTGRVHESANAAIRSMQFEDMVTQILDHVQVKTHRLQELTGKLLAADAGRPGFSAADRDALLLEAVRELTSEALHKAVEQENMDAGDVELF